MGTTNRLTDEPDTGVRAADGDGARYLKEESVSVMIVRRNLLKTTGRPE